MRCPKCGHLDDGCWEITFHGSDVTTVWCGECDYEYQLMRHVSVSYRSEPIKP